ncbi:hypothetical protein V8D89_012319 [Ganoderma adspersum]
MAIVSSLFLVRHFALSSYKPYGRPAHNRNHGRKALSSALGSAIQHIHRYRGLAEHHIALRKSCEENKLADNAEGLWAQIAGPIRGEIRLSLSHPDTLLHKHAARFVTYLRSHSQ